MTAEVTAEVTTEVTTEVTAGPEHHQAGLFSAGGKGKKESYQVVGGKVLQMEMPAETRCALLHRSKQDLTLLGSCVTAEIISVMKESWYFSFFLSLIKKLQSVKKDVFLSVGFFFFLNDLHIKLHLYQRIFRDFEMVAAPSLILPHKRGRTRHEPGLRVYVCSVCSLGRATPCMSSLQPLTRLKSCLWQGLV